MFITTWATTRENPITRTLELTLPDKRGVGNDDDDDVGNQICWNNARFFEYTGTNAFSRIQKVPILQDRFRAKTRRFPTYQDLAVPALIHWKMKVRGTSIRKMPGARENVLQGDRSCADLKLSSSCVMLLPVLLTREALKRARERRWVLLKIPRCDIDGVGEGK